MNARQEFSVSAFTSWFLHLDCYIRVRSQTQTRANPENIVYFRQMSRPGRQRFEVSKNSRQNNSQKHELSPKPKTDLLKYKRGRQKS